MDSRSAPRPTEARSAHGGTLVAPMQNQLANAPTDGPLDRHVRTRSPTTCGSRSPTAATSGARTACRPRACRGCRRRRSSRSRRSTRLLALFVGLGVRGAQGDRRGAHGPRRPPEAGRGCSARSARTSTSRITTNGLLLDRLAAPLARGRRGPRDGLVRLAAAHRFAEMTRRDALDKVLAGHRARRGGRPHADQDQHAS